MIHHIQYRLAKRKTHVLGHENYHKFAIMLPLTLHEEKLSVLFEVRSHKLKRQPGEICFPGGKVDADDKNVLSAAIRETHEELGIDYDEIDVLGELDFLVAPSELIIYPFVGLIKDGAKLSPSPDEVAEIFCVPLEFLLKTKPKLYYVDLQVKPPEDFPFHLIPNGRNYKWRKGRIPEYFYFYEDKVIWGLTARVLHHFLEHYVVRGE